MASVTRTIDENDVTTVTLGDGTSYYVMDCTYCEYPSRTDSYSEASGNVCRWHDNYFGHAIRYE